MAKNHYTERVNRVLDYIAGTLDGDLSLNALARIGNFSPFHFHRVFQGVTGETLNAHVRRVRLERAAQLMKAAPRRRATDIALDVGFPSLSEFSRAFKSHFGLNASAWDRRTPLEKSKIRQAPDEALFYPLEEIERRLNADGLRMKLTRLESCRFVYFRIFNPYGSERLVAAYHALTGWLAERGTALDDVVMVGMSQDDPSITPHERCRYDLGVAFHERSSERGVIGEILKRRKRTGSPAPPTRQECESLGLSARTFEATAVAAIHCVGDIGTVGCAWQYLYRKWLPESRWQPANLPAFEVFARTPEEIGWETFDLYACLPIEKL